MEEKWRDIVGFEGYYQVSNTGKIKSLDRVIMRKNGNKNIIHGKIKETREYKNCEVVTLNKAGKTYIYTLNKIVYEAFNKNLDKDKNVIIYKKNRKSKNVGINNLELVDMTNREKVICITTNKEFNSIQEASRYYKVDACAISKCCRGIKYKSAGKIILDDGTEYKLVWEFIK